MTKFNLDYENLGNNVLCFENGTEVGGGLREFLCALVRLKLGLHFHVFDVLAEWCL